MSKTRVCSTVTSCIIMCIFVQVKSCFLNEWACVGVCVWLWVVRVCTYQRVRDRLSFLDWGNPSVGDNPIWVYWSPSTGKRYPGDDRVLVARVTWHFPLSSVFPDKRVGSCREGLRTIIPSLSLSQMWTRCQSNQTRTMIEAYSRYSLLTHLGSPKIIKHSTISYYT